MSGDECIGIKLPKWACDAMATLAQQENYSYDYLQIENMLLDITFLIEYFWGTRGVALYIDWILSFCLNFHRLFRCYNFL